MPSRTYVHVFNQLFRKLLGKHNLRSGHGVLLYWGGGFKSLCGLSLDNVISKEMLSLIAYCGIGRHIEAIMIAQCGIVLFRNLVL